ncbi:LysR family transcriptional regulator [Oceanimonas sp. GK1]|uniref:LysR family transcriptional regulator n=1 Tax=Oceanimonas sp. (strain GK1 / IBRC-M 10197) TaxID=511062 RepID=UPI00192B3E02|nr:LysR family transcriptional regulator [Oceanimonas sp. GK1]
MNFRFDLRHIKAFMAVAESLHFKKAADSLFITQPALSRLIKGLEESVGVELLARTTRQVALTEAGRLLLAECREGLRVLERGVHLAQAASQGDIGHISIAYNDFSINGVLPDIIERFKEKYPNISIELSHMPSHEQHRALQDCSIDAGFMIGPLNMPGIETLPCAVEGLLVVLPQRHPLAERSSLRLEELRNEKFILGADNCWRAFRSRFLKNCQQAGFSPNIVQEATTSTGIFGLVAANMGISVYTECVRKFTRKDIHLIPLEGIEHQVETIAAWNSAFISPSFAHFIRHLQGEALPA